METRRRMSTRSSAIRTLRPFLTRHPRLKGALRGADRAVSRLHHSAAEHVPALIRPQPRQLTAAITASCNLRCQGCRYGRDFMVGERISLDVMRAVLDDAKDAGVARVRLYGGEPLLHPDVATMIAHSNELGMNTYITTNGVLLGKRIDELYEAGLRWLTMGFYGVDEQYDGYTQRDGHYSRVDESLATVRDRYGDDVEMQLNVVLIRPTTNLDALGAAWEFAERFGMVVHFDLYGHSMPFFTDPKGELGYREEDRAQVEAVGAEIVRLHGLYPERFPQSIEMLRSIPDWLMLGPDMLVPCDAYQLLWLGADGTLQLCDVTFPLGNVNDTRMRDLLFTDEHRQACVDGFKLKCPNCTCKSNTRIMKHAASYRRYSAPR